MKTRRTYQEQPIATLKHAGWCAEIRIEAETGFLTYGIVTTPDGTIHETPHPYSGKDRDRTALLDDCDALLRSYGG